MPLVPWTRWRATRRRMAGVVVECCQKDRTTTTAWQSLADAWLKLRGFRHASTDGRPAERKWLRPKYKGPCCFWQHGPRKFGCGGTHPLRIVGVVGGHVSRRPLADRVEGWLRRGKERWRRRANAPCRPIPAAEHQAATLGFEPVQMRQLGKSEGYARPNSLRCVAAQGDPIHPLPPPLVSRFVTRQGRRR
jgi:hypothetical protein